MKNQGKMHYLHQIFNKFKSIFKHTDNMIMASQYLICKTSDFEQFG